MTHVLRFFLARYDGAEFVIREKARIVLAMVSLYTVGIVVMIGSGQGADPSVLAAMLFGLVACAAFLALLRAGALNLVAHLISVTTLLVILAVMALERGSTVERLDTAAILFGILSIVPLAVARPWQVLLYVAGAAVALVGLVLVQGPSWGMSVEQVTEYLTDSLLGLGLLGVSSFFVLSVHRRAEELSRRELRRVAEQSELLEQQVATRTAELSSVVAELEQRNGELNAARDALWGEMMLAKKIQASLVPLRPSLPGYDIDAHMTPAEAVGGDYYDVISVDGARWLVIADVSGHGVSAGLVMMMAQTAIHTTLASNPALKPSALLAAVNRTLTRNIRSIGEDKYITATVLAASNSGEFTFAGPHLDLLVYRAATGRVENLETRGVWLGILDEIDGLLHDDSVTLAEGDLLLLYTDGVTEAWRPSEGGDRELFGEERLRALLKEHGAAGPRRVSASIVEALQPWSRPDDVTFLAVRRAVEAADVGGLSGGSAG